MTYSETLIKIIDQLEFVDLDCEALLSTASENERRVLQSVKAKILRAADEIRTIKALVSADREDIEI